MLKPSEQRLDSPSPAISFSGGGSGWVIHESAERNHLGTIQVLLGHADIQTTARYLRVSTVRIQAAPNPFDSLPLKPIDLSKDDGRQR